MSMSVNDKVKKILFVDDDIDLLEQLKILMEIRGIEIITAETGKEGWEVFVRERPDAVVLDLMMEHKDSGFVLAHKIKKTDYGKKIPVLLLTSATYDTGYKFDTSSSEEREWVKVDGIINKPIVVEELISKLEIFFESNK